MLTYNLDIEQGSLWLRTTPSEFALKQPYICTEAGIFYARENFNTSRDFKDSWLLFYTLEGCGIIRQNDVTVRVLPGQALLMNCRSPQSYSTDPSVGKWHHYWAHIEGTGLSAMESLLIPERRIAAFPVSGNSIQNQFDIMLKNLESASAETVLMISLSIHQILTDLTVRQPSLWSSNQKLIMKSADYIHDHYCEPIELNELLSIANMSKAYYMRLFRQYIGTTPYNYILSLRITKAKEYLEVTDKSVHEIAMETGFSDDASFSTRFSAMAGMSPLKYRKAAITRNQTLR